MKQIIPFAVLALILCSCKKEVKETRLFANSMGIGDCALTGSWEYKEENSFEISGSGDNIWFGQDQFHFASNETEGDLIMRAKIDFIGDGKHPHRKTGFMFRSGMETNARHVSAVIHGDGLTGIQYRDSAGRDMGEIHTELNTPFAIQFEKKGNTYSLIVADKEGSVDQLQYESNSLDSSFLAGAFICSHDNTVIETAVFKEVILWKTGDNDLESFQDYVSN